MIITEIYKGGVIYGKVIARIMDKVRKKEIIITPGNKHI